MTHHEHLLPTMSVPIFPESSCTWKYSPSGTRIDSASAYGSVADVVVARLPFSWRRLPTAIKSRTRGRLRTFPPTAPSVSAVVSRAYHQTIAATRIGAQRGAPKVRVSVKMPAISIPLVSRVGKSLQSIGLTSYLANRRGPTSKWPSGKLRRKY